MEAEPQIFKRETEPRFFASSSFQSALRMPRVTMLRAAEISGSPCRKSQDFARALAI